MTCPQSELVSGGVRTPTQICVTKHHAPFSIPPHCLKWAGDKNIHWKQRGHLFHQTEKPHGFTSHTYTWTAREQGPGENNAVLPWMKVLLFSGSTCCPWLVHNRRSSQKVGVIMVKGASCQAFWLQERQNRHCSHVLGTSPTTEAYL